MSTDCPSFNVTTAFLKSERRPSRPRKRFDQPVDVEVEGVMAALGQRGRMHVLGDGLRRLREEGARFLGGQRDRLRDVEKMKSQSLMGIGLEIGSRWKSRTGRLTVNLMSMSRPSGRG